MPPTKEELVERAQQVRTLCDLCRIENPKQEELNFRIALMKKLGMAWGLGAMRKVTIDGPAIADTRNPQPKR